MRRTANTGLVQNVSFTGDKLRVQPDVVKGFFNDVCKEIVRHLEEIFRQNENHDIYKILTVEGFSESKILQAAIKHKFRDKVVLPEEAGLTVLKGAVIFGHNPTFITCRVSKDSYGVRTNIRFMPDKHPTEKFLVAEGIEYCSNIFDVQVDTGQEVEDGTTFEMKRYIPFYSNAKKTSLSIFIANKSRPKYTYEEGCQKLRHIEVDLCDLLPSDKKVAVCMKYGGTELHVEAKVVKTGKKANAKFDFLG